ncbi:unnamed protein product [Vitrella brassicaformis CCMP3155]|uniref:Uncharacterized protein n=2 Tax=Vitrella brassicaformis TaxID=1169539 RepID=A0A0G4EQE6_VITBC|nr:unnamed protein product [Vitrella brassicaformis CCMP3155]|eukprot:CEL99855.1 unnamed protein product [Vitrella brassicaformis CCMP3155]
MYSIFLLLLSVAATTAHRSDLLPDERPPGAVRKQIRLRAAQDPSQVTTSSPPSPYGTPSGPTAAAGGLSTTTMSPSPTATGQTMNTSAAASSSAPPTTTQQPSTTTASSVFKPLYDLFTTTTTTPLPTPLFPQPTTTGRPSNASTPTVDEETGPGPKAYAASVGPHGAATGPMRSTTVGPTTTVPPTPSAAVQHKGAAFVFFQESEGQALHQMAKTCSETLSKMQLELAAAFHQTGSAPAATPTATTTPIPYQVIPLRPPGAPAFTPTPAAETTVKDMMQASSTGSSGHSTTPSPTPAKHIVLADTQVMQWVGYWRMVAKCVEESTAMLDDKLFEAHGMHPTDTRRMTTQPPPRASASVVIQR